MIKIKVTRKLSAKPILFREHEIVAKEIWIPKSFIGQISSPNPLHNGIQADEIAEIVCDVLERDGRYITVLNHISPDGDVSEHLEAYIFSEQEGDIAFKATYSKKHIEILGISDGIKKVGKV